MNIGRKTIKSNIIDEKIVTAFKIKHSNILPVRQYV